MRLKPKITDVLLAIDRKDLNDIVRPLLSSEPRMRTRSASSADMLISELRLARWDCLVVTESFDGINYLGLVNLVRSGTTCPPGLPIVALTATPQSGREALEKRYLIRFLEFGALKDISATVTQSIIDRPRPRILVIDDNRDYLSTLERYFSRAFEVVTAASAVEGLQQFERQRPDIVITDYMMPEHTGEDVAKSLRDLSSDAPIIVLTAHASPENHVQLTLAGITQFIDKKVPLAEIEHQCVELLLDAQLAAVSNRVDDHVQSQQKLIDAIQSARTDLVRGRTSFACARLDGALAALDIDVSDDDRRPIREEK